MNIKDVSLDWEQFIEHSIDAMLVNDSNGTIIQANKMAADNLDLTIEDLIGRNVYDLVSNKIYSNSTIIKAMEEKTVITDLVTTRTNRKLLSTSVPIMKNDGELAFVITNSRTYELLEDLYSRINIAETANHRYRETISYLNEINEVSIIADSPQMAAILDYCVGIAGYGGSVLITGESGSGKDMIARFIHKASTRSDNSFVPVNCAAIPRDLFESEFFGYAGGAFTGAKAKGKIGFFEMANGGTLFLDEIGEMPLEMQSKLLRAVETGEFNPVGSSKVIKTDVRIISASNRNLSEMQKTGEFREDLFYRLSVIPIHIPPLRERKEDIIALANAFVDKLNQKYGVNKFFSDRSVETLLSYSWPGNIRELRNVIERSFIISHSEKIEISILERSGAEKSQTDHEAVESSDKAVLSGYFSGTLKEATARFQQDYIEYVLKKHDFMQKEAAEELGVHRTTLYRKKD